MDPKNSGTRLYIFWTLFLFAPRADRCHNVTSCGLVTKLTSFLAPFNLKVITRLISLISIHFYEYIKAIHQFWWIDFGHRFDPLNRQLTVCHWIWLLKWHNSTGNWSHVEAVETLHLTTNSWHWIKQGWFWASRTCPRSPFIDWITRARDVSVTSLRHVISCAMFKAVVGPYVFAFRAPVQVQQRSRPVVVLVLFL